MPTHSKPELKPLTMAVLREVGMPLLEAHYREVALDQTVPLDPNWAFYDVLEQRDMLVSIGAWLDGKLIGYAVSILERLGHYNQLALRNDVLFVTPEHRGTGLGLIRAMEAAAKEERCDLIAWHAKENSALDTLLAGRDGYRVQDIIYTKKV